MTNSIASVFFQDLAGQDPEDVCKRALCEYDEVRKCYVLTVWGEEYAVYPHEAEIECISKEIRGSREYLDLFIIHYLLTSEEIGISGKWISEKDVPGGTAFFRGPHEIPMHLISAQYGNDVEAFGKSCEQLYGIPLDMADAAYRFTIAPRIPVAVLYWEGDEDFPPESKILYDKTINRHLALDIIFALAGEICMRIGQRL